MLTDLYIEALLVDKDLADQVWETWDRGRSITYPMGAWAVSDWPLGTGSLIATDLELP